DDPYGRRLAEELGPANTITFALDDPSAAYRATNIDLTLTGSTFAAPTPDGEIELVSPLRGRFNVSNVLGALAAARAIGVPLETAAQAI
ncbi:Mur ligase family protein, partial [Acinetobacter baumannii]